jgi:hypothetical protein
MSEIAEDELYEMVNLPPRLTGLPMTLWVRPHDSHYALVTSPLRRRQRSVILSESLRA